jgi:hypothetical protein
MSYDIDLVLHALPAVLGDPERHMWPYGGEGSGLFSVYETDPTYNFQPALAAAGLNSLNDLHGMSAPQAAEVLDRTLNRLLANRGFGDLIKGGGTWGTYDGLVQVLIRLKDACDNNPDCEVRCS